MANALFAGMKLTVNGLLRRLGARATITSRENGVLKGYGVFVNSTTEQTSGVDSNSKTVYFQGSDKDPSPAPGDVVTLKNENWAITSVQDINPDGGLTLLFKMQVTQ